jgi:hypothetical protein
MDGAMEDSVEVVNFPLQMVELRTSGWVTPLADQALNGLEGLLNLI